MIVDSSALIAIISGEPEAAQFSMILAGREIHRISAATLVEITIVVDSRKNPILSARLDDLIRESRILVEPVTENHAHIARAAYRDFGKGSGHPAGLNFGDCFSYALAKALAEPLLYKGDDFGHTDIRSAR